MPSGRRQLAAVMLTDMVGFSSLAQRDEPLALELVAEQGTLVRPILTSHRGKLVKTTGDGFLVEFASALNAVQCAIEIQSSIQRRNAAGSSEPIELRIGIHVGDVVHQRQDVFGDAVNIAARIEPLCEPGGVCISQQVYDQVRNKVDVPFVSIGAPELKNIDTRIALYKIALASAHPPRSPSYRRSETPVDVETLRRIVVLPFTNIGPDPNDDYFADGMTEELIERLAHVAGIRVIARTTAMSYKNSPATALEIGRGLRVGMAVECSVRKAGNRLRITAQLIDTASEEHLWAARYDRELTDIFAIQDDISGEIASAISAHVRSPGAVPAPSAVHGQSDTKDITAYTDFLHGRKLYFEKGSETSMRHALKFFEKAVARDPGFARAHVGLADCLQWLGDEGAIHWESSLKAAREELALALELNEGLAEAHSSLAAILLSEDDRAGSEREARRAIELNPSLADPYRMLAQSVAGEGKINETVRLLEEAHGIDPLDVNIMSFLGRSYYYAGREEEALAHWERTGSLVEYRTHAHRAEYYLGHGKYPEAEEQVRELERIRPGNGWTEMYRGLLAARTGDIATARKALNNLERSGEGTSGTLFLAGFVHLDLGEMDEFWASMDRSLAVHMLPLLELRYSPLLAPARADPRFSDLMRRQGLAWP